jgi:hypothetical protein
MQCSCPGRREHPPPAAAPDAGLPAPASFFRVLGGRVEALAEGYETQQKYGGLERPKGTGGLPGAAGPGRCGAPLKPLPAAHHAALRRPGCLARAARACRACSPPDAQACAALRAGEDAERAPAFRQFVPGRDDRRYRDKDSRPAGAKAQPAGAAVPAAAAPAAAGAKGGRGAGGAAASVAMRALQGVVPGAQAALKAAGGAAPAEAAGAKPGAPAAAGAAAKPDAPRALQLGVAPAHLLAPSQSGAAQAKLMEQLQVSESGRQARLAGMACAAAVLPLPLQHPRRCRPRAAPATSAPWPSESRSRCPAASRPAACIGRAERGSRGRGRGRGRRGRHFDDTPDNSMTLEE